MGGALILSAVANRHPRAMPITGPPGYDPSKIPTPEDSIPIPKPDEMKSELMSLWKQLQREGFPKPKPWSEFFAKFTPPNKEDVLSRVHCNVIYYPTNYIILFGIVLAIMMLWNVTGMLSLVLCGGVGWYVITQMKYLELPKGRLVPLQEKQLAV